MKQGWEVKTLKEITTLLGDGLHGTPKYTVDGDYYFINGNNLTDGVIELKSSTKRVSIDEYNQHKKNLTDRTVLVSINGTLGNVAFYNNEKIILGKSACYFNIKEHIDKNYIKHLLSSPYFLTYAHKEATGATIKNVSLKTMREFIVPLPPLKEQQRIVAILDEAFAAIAQAKANAEQNLKNAKELFESYLQSVFENKGEGWINTSIGETCNLQTGGTPSTSKKEFYDGGSIKWLVSGDINQKIINDCEGRITELGMNSSNTKYLPVNSVLIALNGQGKTRGTVAMLKTKASCNQSLVSIYPKDDNSLLPELIFSNLEGRYEEIRRMTGDSGNDRRGLNMPLIRSIKFSYPKNLTDQKDIILKLDNLRTRTKQLEAIYQQKINDLDELKKSILQKAFAGELNTTALEV